MSQSSNLLRFGLAAPSLTVPLWKRLLDITCIVIAIPCLLPFAFLIAATIKALSPGPVLFRQRRVGYHGKLFTCLKFRTMQPGVDSRVHRHYLRLLMKSSKPMRKLDSTGDPRLIPCGLLFRTLGLDELPQLLNVLRGEMSLVGPRPCLPYEYEHLPLHWRRRCRTLPGLTGLWQVSGKNKTSFQQMMHYDLCYAEHKSLLLDLKILAMTPSAILLQAIDLIRHKPISETPASEDSTVATGCGSIPARKHNAEHRCLEFVRRSS